MEEAKILSELKRVREDINNTYLLWDNVNESKAIDMCIYKIASLEAEYSLLLKNYSEVKNNRRSYNGTSIAFT